MDCTLATWSATSRACNNPDLGNVLQQLAVVVAVGDEHVLCVLLLCVLRPHGRHARQGIAAEGGRLRVLVVLPQKPKATHREHGLVVATVGCGIA